MGKTAWIIFVVAAVLIFGVSQQEVDEGKQFKKTGASDVMFRTSNIGYGPGTQIGFNIACDGSDLQTYFYQSAQTYTALNTCAEWTSLGMLVSDVPGTSISNGGTCTSELSLYDLSGTSDYIVCCSISNGIRIARYRDFIGTQSAVSSNPANEKMCPAGPPTCAIPFQDFVNYGNNWVGCGPNTC